MNQVNWRLWQRFWVIAKPYWFSSEKWGARALLAILLVLLLSVSSLEVVSSFVNRDLVTALSQKDSSRFFQLLLTFFGIVLVAITPIAAFYGYVEDKLGLYWRRWLTNHFLEQYFRQRAFYEINANLQIDNPDQRIAEDVKEFTSVALGFLLIVLKSIITLIAFIGILWSISSSLAFVLVAYAAFGTSITALFGRRLIGLNFQQLKREADFRYSLVHVRDNAESIAFYQGEAQELGQVRQRFTEALSNFDRLIGWQRNLAFFTTGYNTLVSVLPAMVVAPRYFAGKVEFGVITQAGLAFSQVFSALSVVVSEFERLSAFVAGIDRLATFADALEAATATRLPQATRIDTVVNSELALAHVTLLTPNYQKTLVKDLSVAVQPGAGLLIVGQSGCGKSSLLRAIAGLWNAGTGCIIRPKLEEMLFLPQRPYMLLGSLHSQLLYPNTNSKILEEKLYQVLRQVNLADLPERVGGLDAELDWVSVLSLGEQQRLAFARLLLMQPRYAILDEATSALDSQNEERLYKQLHATATTFISVGHRPSLVQYHQYVLALAGDFSWQLTPAQSYTSSTSLMD